MSKKHVIISSTKFVENIWIWFEVCQPRAIPVQPHTRPRLANPLYLILPFQSSAERSKIGIILFLCLLQLFTKRNAFISGEICLFAITASFRRISSHFGARSHSRKLRPCLRSSTKSLPKQKKTRHSLSFPNQKFYWFIFEHPQRPSTLSQHSLKLHKRFESSEYSRSCWLSLVPNGFWKPWYEYS